MRLNKLIQINEAEDTGTYISLPVKSTSGKRIVDALSMLLGGNMLDIDDMHVTLMYDENGEIPQGFIRREGVIEYDGMFGAEMFGEDKKTLVLTLETPSEITKRHNRLRAYGLKHSYEKYRPHITLSYDFDIEGRATNFLQMVADAANQRLGKIKFGGENISPVIKNWADDKK